MNEQSDVQLLRDYAERGSEAAFRELVTRHTDFVFSAALRQMNSSDLAGDVVQGVFSDLARRARPLAEKMLAESSLAGWLHRSTRYSALNHLRDTRRRHTKERLAMEQILINSESAPDWERIRPVLDEALDSLGDEDREALLLRYFKNQDFRAVGLALNVSDDTAQKRVSRAVERMREYFSKHNVTIGASGLAVVISANAVQAAPVGLAATISAAAVLAGTAVQTSTIITATKTIAMTTFQKTFVTATIAVAVGAAIYASQLRHQIRSLQEQQTSLADQIQQLQQERDDAKNQLAALQQENEQLHANDMELLKLRGEVTLLRHQQNVLTATSRSETSNLPHAEKISIRVGTKFIIFPTEHLQALGVNWMSGPQGSRAGLLTEQQFKVINEALQGASDVNAMSAPTAITLNGENAQMSVFKPVPAVGTNLNVGVKLSVLPYYSTNTSTFDLNLFAELKKLVGDSLQPDVQTTRITNRMSLLPGQTAVLEQEIPGGGWLSEATNIPAGPRSLLVFVTPTIVDWRDYQQNGSRTAAIWKSPTNTDSPDFPKSQ